MAKLQPIANYTHQRNTHSKQLARKLEGETRKNTYHKGGGDQRGKEAQRPYVDGFKSPTAA